eukprot:4046330-Amphidinium_carterae.1
MPYGNAEWHHLLDQSLLGTLSHLFSADGLIPLGVYWDATALTFFSRRHQIHCPQGDLLASPLLVMMTSEDRKSRSMKKGIKGARLNYFGCSHLPSLSQDSMAYHH